jgi:hypothetical protein
MLNIPGWDVAGLAGVFWAVAGAFLSFGVTSLEVLGSTRIIAIMPKSSCERMWQ